MADLVPINAELWQQVLAASMQKYAKPHDHWKVRQRTVRRYLTKNGKFTDLPTTASDRLLIANALSTQGIVVTANLMARSLDHQWRQYLGTATISFDDFSENVTEPLILRKNNYFGIKPHATLGYELMLPTNRNTRIVLPLDTGYTLISLSRELSRRETKFADREI